MTLREPACHRAPSHCFDAKLVLACALTALGLTLLGCGELTGSDVEAPTANVSRPAQARTASFMVEGMHCEACVTAIKDEVAKLPGVRQVEVSLVDERARVTVADGGATVETIARTIDELGYTATVKP